MTTVATSPVSGMGTLRCRRRPRTAGDPGVSAVEVDLWPADHSQVTVTSEQPLADTAVAAAIDEAGYELASA